MLTLPPRERKVRVLSTVAPSVEVTCSVSVTTCEPFAPRETVKSKSEPNARICFRLIEFQPSGRVARIVKLCSPVGLIPKSPSVMTRQ